VPDSKGNVGKAASAIVKEAKGALEGAAAGSPPLAEASNPKAAALCALVTTRAFPTPALLKVSTRDPVSAEAFFYPQRLLTALVLSVLCLAFAALYSTQLALNAAQAVESLFDSIDAMASKALDAMALGLTAGVDAINLATKTATAVAAKAAAAANAAASSGPPGSPAALASALVASPKALGASLAAKLSLAAAASGGSTDAATAALGDSASGAVLGLLATADATGDSASAASAAAQASAAAAQAASAQLLSTVQSTLSTAINYAAGLDSNPGAQLASTAPPALLAAMNASSAVLGRLGLSRGPGGALGGLASVVGDLVAGRISSTTAAHTLLAQLLGGDVESIAGQVKSYIVTRLWACSGVGIALATLLVGMNLASVAKAYRAFALEARKGRYPGGKGWKWPTPNKAWPLIGVQMALSLVVFVLLFAVVVLVAAALSFVVAEAWFWVKVWDIAWPIVLAVLSLGLLQAVLQNFVISKVLLSGRSIIMPRPYSIADLWFSFMGLIVGAAVAIARITGGIGGALAILVRTDTTIMAARSSDRAVGAFDATLALDLQHTHPGLLAAVAVLTQLLEEGRARRAAAAAASAAGGGGAEGLRGAGPAGLRHPRPLTRWLLALTLARNPALCKERRTDATAAGSLLEAPSTMEKLGLSKVPAVIEGPQGPAYFIWLEEKKAEEASALQRRSSPSSGLIAHPLDAALEAAVMGGAKP
jgi:hypothetical protein